MRFIGKKKKKKIVNNNNNRAKSMFQNAFELMYKYKLLKMFNKNKKLRKLNTSI